MKHIWSHKVMPVAGRDVFKDAYGWQSCGICYRRYNDLCNQCYVAPTVPDAHPYWMFLLCAQKRPDTLFSALQRNVIAHIYSYVIGCPGNDRTVCNVIQLECTHMYHNHCLRQRKQRTLGNTCPTCNRQLLMTGSVYGIQRSEPWTRLEAIVETEATVLQYKRKKARIANIASELEHAICSVLKCVYPGGLTEAELVKAVSDKINDATLYDMEMFYEAQNDMVCSERIQHMEDKWQYSP